MMDIETFEMIYESIAITVALILFVYVIFRGVQFYRIKPENVIALRVQVSCSKSKLTKEEFESLALSHLKVNDLFWMRRDDRKNWTLGRAELEIEPVYFRLELKSGKSLKFKIEEDYRRQASDSKLIKGIMDINPNIPIRWTTERI